MIKKGYTLSEVLITLGVIGVISALTLPTLIHAHKKYVIENKLKKVYSLMNQAIKISEAEYGEVSTWSEFNDNMSIDNRLELFNKYIGKNLHIIKSEKFDDYAIIYLKDTGILRLNKTATIGYYLDKKYINNTTKGVNYFNFRFNPSEYKEKDKYQYGKGFEPYSFDWDGTEDALYNARYGCAKSNHNYCTKLIQYNGWKIPDNYPLKF